MQNFKNASLVREGGGFSAVGRQESWQVGTSYTSVVSHVSKPRLTL